MFDVGTHLVVDNLKRRASDCHNEPIVTILRHDILCFGGEVRPETSFFEERLKCSPVLAALWQGNNVCVNALQVFTCTRYVCEAEAKQDNV